MSMAIFNSYVKLPKGMWFCMRCFYHVFIPLIMRKSSNEDHTEDHLRCHVWWSVWRLPFAHSPGASSSSSGVKFFHWALQWMRDSSLVWLESRRQQSCFFAGNLTAGRLAASSSKPFRGSLDLKMICLQWEFLQSPSSQKRLEIQLQLANCTTFFWTLTSLQISIWVV